MIDIKIWQAVAITVFLWIVPFAAGWFIGVDSGYETAQKITLLQVGTEFKEMSAERRKFRLKYIDGIVFYPRKDGGLNYNYSREFTIAGAGSEGAVKTWEGKSNAD